MLAPLRKQARAFAVAKFQLGAGMSPRGLGGTLVSLLAAILSQEACERGGGL